MGVESIINALLGRGTKTTEIPAQPLDRYPTSEDAAFASKYGFGYGDPRLDMSSGSARVLGTVDTAGGKRLPTFVPRSGEGSYLNELTGAVDGGGSAVLSQAPSRVADALQRSALTANRIPIAALGFDPTRMVADTQMKSPTVGGAYSPSKDSIYYNMPEGRDPSTPVHESIHRGLEILRKDPANAEAFKNAPDEESLVRYLMAKYAGDPEKGSGKLGDQQRDYALALIDGGYTRYTNGISALTRAAEEAIAKRRPGGPR